MPHARDAHGAGTRLHVSAGACRCRSPGARPPCGRSPPGTGQGPRRTPHGEPSRSSASRFRPSCCRHGVGTRGHHTTRTARAVRDAPAATSCLCGSTPRRQQIGVKDATAVWVTRGCAQRTLRSTRRDMPPPPRSVTPCPPGGAAARPGRPEAGPAEGGTTPATGGRVVQPRRATSPSNGARTTTATLSTTRPTTRTPTTSRRSRWARPG